MQKTFLDFFAGSGLVSFALLPWFKAVWANDISNDKFRVYAANLPAFPFRIGPIENIRGKDVPPADLSWGSFPCQDLSLAGKAEGLSGTRSGLFRQWIRVMGEMSRRPPVAVAENVTGLLSLDGGRHYLEVHEALSALGYQVGALVLDAAKWIPQSRKRVFVVAARANLDIRSLCADGPLWCHPASVRDVARRAGKWVWWRLPEPPPCPVVLENIIDFSLPCDRLPKTRHLVSLLSDRHRKIVDSALRSGGRRVFPGYRRTRNHRQMLEIRDDGIAGCLRTPRGGSSRQLILIAENGRLRSRLLSSRETAALMGAPDFVLPGTYNDSCMAMGDGVAVPVAAWLAEKLLFPLASLAGGVQ
jgi:DNA (cytosine-5)-methyltransferase 1